MITSVSVFSRRIGAATELSVANFSIIALAPHPAHVGDGPGNRRGRGHGRAGQVCACARALAADDVLISKMSSLSCKKSNSSGDNLE
jgi:hypothetical protein